MSKAPAFAGLKKTLTEQDAPPPVAEAPPKTRIKQRGGRRPMPEGSGAAAARADKKAVVGYYHPDVNKWLRGKALEQDTTLQRVVFDFINMGRKADKLPPFPDTYEKPDDA